jgi:hypothetical protein
MAKARSSGAQPRAAKEQQSFVCTAKAWQGQGVRSIEKQRLGGVLQIRAKAENSEAGQRRCIVRQSKGRARYCYAVE